MKRIVIVEDRLRRAVALAEQFEGLKEEYPEWGIQDIVICFFCERPIEKEQDIRLARDSCRFSIKDVGILNFNKIMDEYMEDEETFLIIDFFLEGDGSDGEPLNRLNIRYARNKDRYKSNRLWFYTATGSDNEMILGKLLGKEHMVYVAEVDDDLLKLELNNTDFRRVLENEQMINAEG